MERVLDALEDEEEYPTGAYDGSAGVEVIRMDQSVIEDVASTTANRVRRELDPGLR